MSFSQRPQCWEKPSCHLTKFGGRWVGSIYRNSTSFLFWLATKQNHRYLRTEISCLFVFFCFILFCFVFLLQLSVESGAIYGFSSWLFHLCPNPSTRSPKALSLMWLSRNLTDCRPSWSTPLTQYLLFCLFVCFFHPHKAPFEAQDREATK